MESAKKLALTAALSQYNKVLVAFSGGIDSTVVLDAALKTLGKENVLAVVANLTGDSTSFRFHFTVDTLVLG